MDDKYITPRQIFIFFVKTGCITFGGGWSIIAQMQSQLIEKRDWLTQEDMLNLITVSKSLPGIMVCNLSYLCGHHLCGVLGGIAGLIGISLAPFVILCILTYFYATMRDNQLIAQAIIGIRAAIVPIICFALRRMQIGALNNMSDWIIMISCVILAVFTTVSSVWIIVLAAIIGILLGRFTHAPH